MLIVIDIWMLANHGVMVTTTTPASNEDIAVGTVLRCGTRSWKVAKVIPMVQTFGSHVGRRSLDLTLEGLGQDDLRPGDVLMVGAP